jgi:hypothetical protein
MFQKFKLKNQIVMINKKMFLIPVCREWFSDESNYVRGSLCLNVDHVVLMYKTLGLYFVEVGSHKFQIELKEFNELFDLLNGTKNTAI